MIKKCEDEQYFSLSEIGWLLMLEYKQFIDASMIELTEFCSFQLVTCSNGCTFGIHVRKCTIDFGMFQ